MIHIEWQDSLGDVEKTGGDPQRVMIYGESAGATSVSVQSVLPSSFGLFQRAAMDSVRTLYSVLCTLYPVPCCCCSGGLSGFAGMQPTCNACAASQPASQPASRPASQPASVQHLLT
jgi:hypothetical protein